MSDIAFARATIREAFPHGKIKCRKIAAYEFLKERGWSWRRVRAVWDGEARQIAVEEKEALQDAKAQAFPAHLQSLRQAMLSTDAEFYSEQIRTLERVERSLRAAHGLDQTVEG